MKKNRKVSSISKEFDGKEIQGKLIERSGLLGSKVSKEVFKMPSGGKHIEKTRINKKGDVVSRLSKDTKVNPLKLFNDNKQQAIKKAGGEMSAYKKSLKKAQDGGSKDNPYKSYVGKPSFPIAQGPLEEYDVQKLNSKYPGTSAPMTYTNDELNKIAKTYGSSSSRPPLAVESDLRKMEEQEIRGNDMDMFNSGRYEGYKKMLKNDALNKNKKGGSVKRKKK
jgi:hypothetical protein